MEPIKIKEPKKLIEALNNLDFLEIMKDRPKNGDFKIKISNNSWFERLCKMNYIATYIKENNEVSIHGDLAYQFKDNDQLINFLGVIKLSSK